MYLNMRILTFNQTKAIKNWKKQER